MISYSDCRLCPRQCGVDRHSVLGFCRQSDKVKIARADLHFWEEPCISGESGSGTVFFSGCTLRCCFCQNHEISHDGKGYEITVKELSDIFLQLQEKGANNINLVSPTPFVPSIIEAIDLAKPKLSIPIIYNCGGYESLETIKMLDGYIDIYLPDLKYFDGQYASKYSDCKDYFNTSFAAIIAMQKQVGKPVYDEKGIMKKGVIVRHLALPTLRHDSIRLIEALGKQFSKDEIVLSVMSQYIPLYKACEHKEINRRISTFEYNSILEAAEQFGFDGYSQERSSSQEVYIPPFTEEKPTEND